MSENLAHVGLLVLFIALAIAAFVDARREPASATQPQTRRRGTAAAGYDPALGAPSRPREVDAVHRTPLGMFRRVQDSMSIGLRVARGLAWRLCLRQRDAAQAGAGGQS